MPDEIRTTVKGRWHLREVVRDGHSISRVSVPDHRTRLLGVTVRMGGIGGVETNREHRMQGHSRRLLTDTVAYMTDLGQDVSMLWGISDFYDKFGFSPFMAEHTVRVATRDAERITDGAAGCAGRPMEPADAEFVVHLYNSDNALRPASLVRDPAGFHGFRKGSDYRRRAAGRVFEDDAGRPVGYAVADDSQTDVHVVEAAAVDPRFFPCMLQHFARLAVDRRCGDLALQAPPDHPLARYCVRCGATVRSVYPRMGNGMMRILNQGPLFGKLTPALEARLTQGRFAQSPLALTLETDLDTTDLQLNRSAEGDELVVRASLPQGKLMQLLVGYRRADDVLADPDVESWGPAQDVLDLLFAGQVPYVWQTDRF
jgi:predicted acetyltransferase